MVAKEDKNIYVTKIGFQSSLNSLENATRNFIKESFKEGISKCSTADEMIYRLGLETAYKVFYDEHTTIKNIKSSIREGIKF